MAKKDKDDTVNDTEDEIEEEVNDEEEKDDEMEVEKEDEETGAEEEEEEEEEDEEDDEESKTKGSSTTTGGSEKKKMKKKSITQLPVARIRRIIKSDKDVKLISNDAALLITKSTEMFLEYVVKEAYKKTTGKRKILSYKELSSVVKEIDSLEFLTDIIPPKVIT